MDRFAHKDRKKYPELWWEYMEWLCNKMRFDKKRYYKLIKHLHSVPFEASRSVSKDFNRIDDGLYQRRYFFMSCGLLGADFDVPCSVFEVLSALSVRMSSDYLGFDSDGYENVDIIFAFFLKNLGLLEYENDVFNEEIEEEIDEKIDIFMYRWYKNDGIGSLFPLKRPKKGYNEMEIWDQMNVFLTENRISGIEDLEKFL